MMSRILFFVCTGLLLSACAKEDAAQTAEVIESTEKGAAAVASVPEPPEAESILPPKVGDTAPSWTGAHILDGSTISFPEVLNESPAVLVFWATWCPYCKAFMPYTQDIQQDYTAEGVQILTFNAKERGRGDPRAYIESLGFPMVPVADADEIASLYGVEYIPGLMVVDGTGQIVYQRGWTDLPAGQKVAEQWDLEVRRALDNSLGLAESEG
ncbi:MAG: TlpA disulfide reductase family protein [Pseudomonadota bacterium]